MLVKTSKTENKRIKEEKNSEEGLTRPQSSTGPGLAQPTIKASPSHHTVLTFFFLKTTSSSVEHWRALDPPPPLQRSR
jgi:hypothetical protein